jgi:NTP pyrophosphatase (non-canonical NTP hydrolase)
MIPYNDTLTEGMKFPVSVTGTDGINDDKWMPYEKFVCNLIKERGSEQMNLEHMVIGIFGEGGELADAVKKFSIYGKPLDRANLVEEFGDLEFYLAGLRQMLDISRYETLAGNIQKLQARYKDGYSDAAAIARADKAATGETSSSGAAESGSHPAYGSNDQPRSVYETVLGEKHQQEISRTGQVNAINLSAEQVAAVDETAGVTTVADQRDDAIGTAFAIGEITKEQADYLQQHPELPLSHFDSHPAQPLP